MTKLVSFPLAHSETSYSVPSTVYIINDYAFYKNSNLQAIEFPEGLGMIRNYAFSGCTALKTLKFPNRLASINDNAFRGCSSLESITLPKTANTLLGTSAFSSCGLKELTVPGNIKTIGTGTFEHNINLLSLTLEDGVTTLRDGSFIGCSNLLETSLPQSVRAIGRGAFATCSSLKEFVFPDNVATPGDFVLRAASALESVHLPANMTKVGKGMLIQCNQVKEVELDAANPYYIMEDGIMFDTAREQLVYITPRKDFSSMKYQYFVPNTVKTICTGAVGATRLKSVVLPSNLETIEDLAFLENTSIKELTIPARVTAIGKAAFNSGSSNSYATAFTSLFFMGDATIPSFDTRVMTLPSGYVNSGFSYYMRNYVGCTFYVKKSAYENGKYNSLASGSLRSSYKIPATPPSSGLMTLCRDFDADFTDTEVTQGLNAYVATRYDEEGEQMEMTEIGYVPSRTGSDNDEYMGVVLRGTGEGLYYKIGERDYDSDSQATFAGKNLLVGAPVYTQVEAAADGYTHYGLNSGRFRKYTRDGLITYNRAYLRLPSTITTHAAALSFLFVDEGTETTSIESTKGEKRDDKAVFHDLQGRKVTQPSRGIYLHKGRKVIVR